MFEFALKNNSWNVWDNIHNGEAIFSALESVCGIISIALLIKLSSAICLEILVFNESLLPWVLCGYAAISHCLEIKSGLGRNHILDFRLITDDEIDLRQV